MTEDNTTQPWQAIVASSLAWREAHATFDDAVAGLSAELRGRRPAGFPHSAWELLEHIRLAQADLLAFMQDASYSAPKWPDDYWPSNPAPPDDTAWDESIAAVQRGREELKAIATSPTLDLTAKVPRGNGQTYLRTILVVMDHTAYHVGQLIAVRQVLGAWPAEWGRSGDGVGTEWGRSGDGVGTDSDSTKLYPSTIASTRNGLPLPFTILSGAAITTAPVGGS